MLARNSVLQQNLALERAEHAGTRLQVSALQEKLAAQIKNEEELLSVACSAAETLERENDLLVVELEKAKLACADVETRLLAAFSRGKEKAAEEMRPA